MNGKKWENIAHVRKLPDNTWDNPHLLLDHLEGTAQLSANFAKNFNSEVWGRVLGLAHDTGKSPETWQRYLIQKSGFGEDDAHIEGNPRTVEHSTSSAKLAEEIFGKFVGRILAYCIAGHHCGLPDWYSGNQHGQSALSYRLIQAKTIEICQEMKTAVALEKPSSPPWKFDNKNLDLSLWVRMLFSCLVDADFLDTEKYMDEEKAEERSGYRSVKELLFLFNDFISKKIDDSEKTSVNELRQSILSDCRKAASNPPGIFSLTVPTGGGKTLSSLAFALEHAVLHTMDRIIYVIPYTSIIEQNADVFRKALGDDQVVEHHASLDEDESTTKSRLSAENWDAPVIVTTSVQFFESLFANKTSRCRKLHNISNSIVILDEAQMLPVEYLTPILQTMELLKSRYKVTFIISTATQPALECRPDFKEFKGLPLGSVHEIISDVPKLYRELKRVTVEIPIDWRKPLSWEEVAKSLVAEQRVLCVVSDRKSCRELFHLMPKGTYHLSALMCGKQRSDIIAKIKNELVNKTEEPLRVISTQLVEAGVDLDFPVVFRALAGLDSIAQAAGRCNREGRLMTGLGRVVVFIPPKKSPPGILRKAAETTETMLKAGTSDPLDHEIFKQFFGALYWKANSLDKMGIIDLLKPDQEECGIQFRSAAEKFKLIDDSQQRTVLVPYGKGKEYIDMLKTQGPERWLLRKLQRYSVNVYTKDFAVLLSKNWIAEISPNVFALISDAGYDLQTGLLVDEISFDPEKFIM
jgi:CRISPR-associated endonuclease/helicase Cas3